MSESIPPQCPSIHIWSDLGCLRDAGHDGYCWGPAQRGKDGTVTRPEWISKDGVFKSHHQYATIYPANARRAES